MTFQQSVYQHLKNFNGLTEISGPKDHPVIVLAHKFCRIVGENTKATHIDEIPWCAAIMNLAIILANIERNPLGAFNALKQKGFGPVIIEEAFNLIGYSIKTAYDTKKSFIPPTYSAAAISFAEIGVPVSRKSIQEGDFIVFTRKGGNHIAIFQKENMFTFKVFGGNQNNMVCSSESYLKNRYLTARRLIG